MQKKPLKDRLKDAALIAAYAWLPYSLSAVALGAGGYYSYGLYRRLRYGERAELGNADWDADGAIFTAYVVGAPISLPVLAIDKARRLFGRAEPDERAQGRAAARRRLATAFAAAHIPFDEKWGLLEGVFLEASPSGVPQYPGGTTQCRIFGDIVAGAVHRFPEVGLEGIAALVRPHRLLDRAWAERHGFADWAEDVALPCRRCDRQGDARWIFGRRRIELFRAHEAKATVFWLHDQPDRVLTLLAEDRIHAPHGPICGRCRDELDAGSRDARDNAGRP